MKVEEVIFILKELNNLDLPKGCFKLVPDNLNNNNNYPNRSLNSSFNCQYNKKES